MQLRSLAAQFALRVSRIAACHRVVLLPQQTYLGRHTFACGRKHFCRLRISDVPSNRHDSSKDPRKMPQREDALEGHMHT